MLVSLESDIYVLFFLPVLIFFQLCLAFKSINFYSQYIYYNIDIFLFNRYTLVYADYHLESKFFFYLVPISFGSFLVYLFITLSLELTNQLFTLEDVKPLSFANCYFY